MSAYKPNSKGNQMTNTGTPYEIFTQHIFQKILNQDSVTTIDVQHNVVIKGKTAKHQIDVYWKFKLNDVVYETIVQAKDWGQKVDQGKLLQFKSVIEDIPGSPKGIFVTRKGYQSGAKTYAEAHGIVLYELREPQGSDFDGKIKEIHIKLHLLTPMIDDVKPIPDVDWVQYEKKRLGLENQEIRISIEDDADKIFFEDSSGNNIVSFFEAQGELIPNAACRLERKEYMFEDPLYIQSGDPMFPRIKCLGISANVSVSENVVEMLLEDDPVPFILKNVVTGDIKKIDRMPDSS